MAGTGFLVKRYEVHVDRSSLRKGDVSRSPLGEERCRFAVELAGQVDEHWRRCFRLVQMDDTGFFRFRLDIAKSVITFTSPEGEGSPDSGFDLMRLDTLVGMVNRRASVAA